MFKNAVMAASFLSAELSGLNFLSAGFVDIDW